MPVNPRLCALLRVFLALVLIGSCAFAVGCGKKETDSAGEQVKNTEPATPGAKTEPGSPDGADEGSTPSDTTPTDPASTGEEEAVIAAALAAARSNNPELPELEVLSVKIVGDWARVVVSAVDGSTDAAGAYLRKENGAWVVFDFGTGIGPDLYPEAPPELFN